MTEFIRYSHDHMSRILEMPVEAQTADTALIRPEHAVALEQTLAYTVIEGDMLLAVGGVLPMWQDRLVLWAFFTPHAGPHMMKILRRTKGLIARARWKRIELTTRVGNKSAERMARILGFRLECGFMANYFPDGGDAMMWARVNR